jgi:hypothetical protein
MPENKILMVIIHFLVIRSIMCRFEEEDFHNMRVKAQQVLKERAIKFAEITFNKFKSNTLNDDDLVVLMYLAVEIIRKINALTTPPVYWYSRKG